MHTHVQSMVLRELQHIATASHSDHSEEGHQHTSDHTPNGLGTSTLNLRIAALFIILFGGLIGVVPPICGKWLTTDPDSMAARALRAFSGGTIIALALVHIIPEGYEQLGGLMDYPIAGIPVVGGLLLLVFLDYLMSYIMAGRQLQRAGLPTTTVAAAPTAADAKGLDVAQQKRHPPNLHACCPVEAGRGAAAASPHTAGAGPDMSIVVAASANVGVAATGVNPFSHSHHHLPACHITTIKHYVACYSMELGCVFHSIIIGVGIGVLTEQPQLILTLTAVMVFHQALEGLALGSVLARTQLTMLKKACMAALYALCLPAGIAIGIKVSDTYDAESVTSVAVQGSLNCVSGGMLLYVSMYHLIGEEFSKHDLLYRPRLAGLLVLAVLLGVAGMCVIGIWG